MDIPVEKYNATNETQLTLAHILFDRVKKARESEKMKDLVIDIGSGSGNVTELFAKNINYKRLVGLDIDTKMVEFAKENNKNEKISYLECDMEKPWDQQSGEVKQLEGQCQLALASTVLHWMANVETAAINISKLLASGSRFFALIADLNCVYEPSSKHSAEFYSILPLFEGKNNLDKWKAELQRNQIKIDNVEMVHVDHNVTYENLQIWIRGSRTLLKNHLPKEIELEEFLKKFPEVQTDTEMATYKLKGKKTADGEDLYTANLKFWIITASKL